MPQFCSYSFPSTFSPPIHPFPSTSNSPSLKLFEQGTKERKIKLQLCTLFEGNHFPSKIVFVQPDVPSGNASEGWETYQCTTFKFLRSSGDGVLCPQTSGTLTSAWSCQSWYVAINFKHHAALFMDASWLAKYMVLQFSAISFSWSVFKVSKYMLIAAVSGTFDYFFFVRNPSHVSSPPFLLRHLLISPSLCSSIISLSP